MGWQHWVFLSGEQLERATAVGTSRQTRARLHGFKHKNNLEDDDARDLRRHVTAAKSELATKVLLGPWASWIDHGEDFRGKADVEDFIDVKAVLQKRLRLILHALDRKPDFAYVLVYCEEPWFLVKGWQWGREITRLAELQKGRPHYIAEDAELRDPESLIRVAFERRRGA